MAARIGIYRWYGYRDKKDPIIWAAKAMIEDEGLSVSRASQISGLTCLSNWFDGDTMNPKNASSTNLAASLGYVRRDILNKDGTVTPHFERMREIKAEDQYVAQAKFLIKQGGRKKKVGERMLELLDQRFKKNGHAR